ncbi:MAG: EamA family transporter [Alistipes sp.]|nr:EamA family transporter [Alistipes sp.]MBP3551123.1 EamA family transporter [Alistipes sp.]
MREKNSILGHIACFTAYLIFGLNIIVCKDLTSSDTISPLALFTLRSLGAGLLFWFISLFMPKERVERRDLPKIFAASVLGFFLAQITFLMAISQITPMDCSIVASLSPLYTMFIAAFALKEPISAKKIGGVVLSLCGVLYLIINSVTTTSSTVQTTPVGVLLIVANSLCFSLYLGVFKPLIGKYSVVTFMKWIFLFSTLMSLPFSAKELAAVDFAALPLSYIAELSFLIFCATFVTYFLIPIGQKRLRPTLVSMYSYVQPIIAIVVSICIGMDTLSWQKVAAAITVFSGVIIVSRSKQRDTANQN